LNLLSFAPHLAMRPVPFSAPVRFEALEQHLTSGWPNGEVRMTQYDAKKNTRKYPSGSPGAGMSRNELLLGELKPPADRRAILEI